MDNRSALILWLVVWAVMIIIVTNAQWSKKNPSVGLPIAYLFSLSMIHWFGGLIYTFPWYTAKHPYLTQSGVSLENVSAGFFESAYGVVGFAIGSVLLAPWFINTIKPAWIIDNFTYQPNLKLPKTYLTVGLTFYFVLSPIAGIIPSLGSIISCGLSLLIIGLCLGCWKSWINRDKKAFFTWLGFAIFMPIITITTQGFIGYGAAAASVVILFVFSFYKPRWQITVAALLAIIFGLSVFVTYMRDRGVIRASVWGGQDLESRIDRFTKTFSDFEIFDPFKQDHLETIDGRLNQNFLVGKAVLYMSDTKKDFANGETILQAAIGPIPRLLWPDKPAVGGSGNIVTTYTGIPFAAGTSVGVGQVLEFYINFGSPGVVIGFTIFGTIIRILDMAAGQRLVSGNWVGFTSWFLPGLALMQPGGALIEVVTTFSASIVLVFILNKTYLPKAKRMPNYPPQYYQYYPEEITPK